MTGYFGAGKLWANREYKKQPEDFMAERAKEVLRAMGQLIDFDVSDIPEDELREKVEIVARCKRMREADFSISQERLCSARRTGNSLIWDEVMK
ncbi:MAG: hypothetical protein A2283_11515 [Lentisphaerae bacterium RIFOXYA12_FULL_48_11]|nr:MAG: hypothetical protein A2283_11515 [Lentisphaerae bacterium RIFOXYA12_FULL_48_11]